MLLANSVASRRGDSCFILICLSCVVITDWLRQMNRGELVALAADAHLVAQLNEITQGFPLYLRSVGDER
jgi:hypothetical protein